MPTVKKITKQTVERATKKVTAKKSPAKKATKKVTAKKVVAKKNTTRKTATKTAKKVLVCADDEKCFWMTDGQILRDLNDLQQAFATMEEAVFKHHVRKDSNDFASWVEHVLNDVLCATDLRQATKPSQARTIVVRHLRSYYL